MAVRRGVGRLAHVAGAAVLAVGALLPAAIPTAAADPVLPRPTAVVRFLSSVTFTGTARLSAPVRRLEIVIEVEGSRASFVADVVTSQASGPVDLSYVLDTPGGSLYPNTDLTARFRATLDDGTAVEGPAATISYDDTRFAWQTLSGDLMTVNWVEGDAAFGRRALRIGEDSVRAASELFGVAETERIDFFIYPDNTSFYDVLGAGSRENVGGTALPEIRTLFARIEPGRIDDPWVGVVIPHELTHVVFSTATRNPYHAPLRWLDEGIATYLSESLTETDRIAIDAATASGALMPLRGLVGQFPTSTDQFSLAYSESVSAVAFLVRTYGQAALVKLIRSYQGGVTDDEAFVAALGTDTAGFEAAWLDELGAPAPTEYGPREAAAGPVPSDWLGEARETQAPAAPDGGAPAALDGTTGLLAALVVVGLVLAGLGRWLARRRRPVAGRPEQPVGQGSISTPPDTPDSTPDTAIVGEERVP